MPRQDAKKKLYEQLYELAQNLHGAGSETLAIELYALGVRAAALQLELDHFRSVYGSYRSLEND